jgi:hypothetical protein
MPLFIRQAGAVAQRVDHTRASHRLFDWLGPLWRQFWAKRWGFLWCLWHYSGLREMCALAAPNWKAATEPKASTFLLWFIGMYVALFGLTSQRYESRLDQIENRANGIYAQLGASNWKKALERIPRAQAMTLPRKPELWPPWSMLCSLVLCQQEPDAENVQALIETIETFQDLKEVDLSEAYLFWAYLSGANLSGADLSRANLNLAHLSGADLSRANLNRANLNRADLSKAHLSGANLNRTDLSLANLDGANLSGAFWNQETQWPEGFTPPCPVSKPDAPCQAKK